MDQKNLYTNECVLENGEHLSIPAMEGHKDVFLSYKRENVRYVVRLYHELERHFIKSWLDISELPQHVGDEYRDKIHKGIDSSKYFLLIYTKEVEKSDFIINDEVGYAKSKGKKILFYPKDPIDIESSRLKPYVEAIQWLDTEATAIHQASIQEALKDEKKQEELSKLINARGDFSHHDDQSLFLIRIAMQRILGKTTVFGNYQKLCGAHLNGFYSPEDFCVGVINKSLFITPPEAFKNELEEKKFFRKDKVEQVENHLKRVAPDNTELLAKLYDFLRDNSSRYPLSLLHERLSSYLSNDKYSRVVIPPVEDFTLDAFVDVIAQLVSCAFIADLDKKKVMFNGAELGVYSISDGRKLNAENPVIDMDLYYSDYFTFKCMTEMYHVLCSIDDKPFIVRDLSDIRAISPFLCSLGLGGFVATRTRQGSSLMWTKRSGNISSGDMWHFSYDETVSLLKDAVTEADGSIAVDAENRVTIDASKILYRALKEEVGAVGLSVDEDDFGLFEVGLIKSERLEVELISHAVLHLSDDRTIDEQIMEMHDAASDGYLEISKIEFLPLRDANTLVGRLLSPESYAIYQRMKTRIKDYAGKRTKVGDNTVVEAGSYIEDGAQVGDYCKIHRNVHIGKGVKIGDYCKIQNNNSIYPGVTLDYGVFVGTNVTFINDKYPRAIRRDGQPVTGADWEMKPTFVGRGASIGAGAVIMCGVTIGPWAMVGAGAVVLEDVPEGAVVVGNPARIIKYDL